MRQRILAALAILLSQSIPHEWTDCPANEPGWTFTLEDLSTPDHFIVTDRGLS